VVSPVDRILRQRHRASRLTQTENQKLPPAPTSTITLARTPTPYTLVVRALLQLPPPQHTHLPLSSPHVNIWSTELGTRTTTRTTTTSGPPPPTPTRERNLRRLTPRYAYSSCAASFLPLDTFYATYPQPWSNQMPSRSHRRPRLPQALPPRATAI
jgi:hypothetical protein